jgi:protein SCO1/2
VLAGDPSEFAFRPHPGAHLPLVAGFVDEQGREVLVGQYFNGKPVVLVLDYLRCQTLCGVTLQNLVAALDVLPLDAGRDFQLVVISIDPRDKPADVEAAKIKYLADYHHPRAGDGWHFLTGRQGMVRSVADAVGFPYRYETELDQYIHPAGFVLAAPDGNISRYLLGVDIHPDTLRAALADAARGKAVGLVERLLLLCHGKDPNLGPYSLMIEGAFIIANLIAMAGGCAVFVAIWRRRHG